MYIQIIFEDTYGLYEFYKRLQPEICNKFKFENIIVKSLQGTQVYTGLSGNEILNNGIDFTIVFFDLDPQGDSKERNIMLTSEYINKLFRAKSNRANTCNLFDKDYINSSGIKTYVGDRVILMPVFFSFETLYFYSKSFYKMFKEVIDTVQQNYDNEFDILASLPEVIENYATYISRHEGDKFIQPQTIYANNSTEVFKHWLESLNYDIKNKVSTVFESKGIERYKISEQEILANLPNQSLSKCMKKRTDIILDLLKSENIDLVTEICTGMNKYNLFNRDLYKLLKCSSEELPAILSRYTVENYWSTLRYKLDLYYDLYTKGVNDTETQKQLNKLRKDINSKASIITCTMFFG